MPCSHEGDKRHGCLVCRKEQKPWLTPEWKANKKAARARRRAKVIAHYGGKCTCCGETESAFLTMDHIEGGGRTHRAGSDAKDIYPWLIRNDFPDGFQVHCWNCNAAKYFEGECPHVRSDG